MLPIRRSLAARSNERLHKVGRHRAPTNMAMLRQAAQEAGLGQPGDLVLLGGSSVADFRVRVAQSHARHDMTPSYWSLVGILADAATLITVPLWPLPEPDLVPATNAIQRLPLADFDDPDRYPNLAVVHFPGATEPVTAVADRLRAQRSVIDLPNLLLAWLGFVWGTGGSPNPLLDGLGLPSATLVETAFGIAQVELTPGLASASSCPEAIWQAAKWWHAFYRQAAAADVAARDAGSRSRARAEAAPTGHYVLRQPEASYNVPG